MIVYCENCKKKFHQLSNASKLERKEMECKFCNTKLLYESETTLLDKDLDNKKILFDKTQVKLQNIKDQKLLIDEDTKDNILEVLNEKIKNLDEANKKIKFYQDDNVRLSSEVNSIKNKYQIIKDNFNKTEKEKNDIFKQVQELNNSLLKNNIIGSPFLKEKIEEVNISSKTLNDITENNLKDSKTSVPDNDLNVLVKDIFK